MDEIGFQPQEVSERGEAAESTETRALDDATFEPEACLEQAGDYQQAEAIQSGLAEVINNVISQTVEASSVGGVSGSGGEQVGITPINLPREADLASNAGGVVGSGAEGVGITPINLPREADLASGIELPGSAVAFGESKGPGGDGVASGAVKGPGGDGVASGAVKGPGGDGVMSAPVPQPVPDVADSGLEGLGAMPDPIPHPEDEIGFKFVTKEPTGSVEIPLAGMKGIPGEEIGAKGTVKGTEGVVEIPLAGTAGEAVYKEQVGTCPISIPHPAEEIGVAGYVKEQVGEVPTSIPQPTEEIGFKYLHKEPTGAGEVPLPGITGEGGLTEEAAIEQVVVRTEAAIEEMSVSFNLQYMMLQN
jgi:hypothetical protein